MQQERNIQDRNFRQKKMREIAARRGDMMKHDLIQKNVLMIWFMCVMMIIAFTVLFVTPEGVRAEDNKPVAVVDGTLQVKVGKTVYLDGTYSSDPGGANLDYKWTLLSSPNGSSAVLSPSGAEVSFQADVAGTFRVKLIVNNGLSDSDPAYAVITVTEGEQPGNK